MKNILYLLCFVVLHSYSQKCNYALNSGFDSVNIAGTSVALVNASLVPSWKTTATDNKIEVWYNGYNGISSSSGIQFIEINGSMPATVFQTVTATPGTSLSISFAHRGRGGIDSISVSAGPVGGPYTTLTKVGDSQAAWGTYTINYIVPNLGNQYSIRFNSIYWALGNPAIGNFLDAVKICGQEEQISTSLSKNDLNLKCLIYPNPSNANVYFKFPENYALDKELFFYNQQGELIKHILLGSEKEYTLLKGDISSGIYFYILRNSKHTESGKLVINE